MSKTAEQAFEKWRKREHPNAILGRAQELQEAYMAGRREARNELRRSATAKKARELSQARRLVGLSQDPIPARFDRLKAELERLGIVLHEMSVEPRLGYACVAVARHPATRTRLQIDLDLVQPGSNMRQAAAAISLELTKRE